MSLLGKLMDTMRLNPDEEEDDYYLDDDFEEEAPRRDCSQRRIRNMMRKRSRTSPGF